MKILLYVVALVTCTLFNAQSKKSTSPKPNLDLVKINDSIPDLIPQKMNGKYGFINQKGKVIVPHLYSNVGFFTEDCRLQNSPSETIRKYGSADYASVRKNNIDYRINKFGKIVYEFKDADLGRCNGEYRGQLFHAYVKNGFYGLIEDSRFHDESDYRQFSIYPQYELLHVLEGDDLKNPMIVAVHHDLYGVINSKNQVIIPFVYQDIKLDFSWKIGRLFKVSTDGTNYYYIDINGNTY